MSAQPTARDPGAVGVFVALVASAASVCLALAGKDAWQQASARPVAFATFIGLALLLQALSVEVYGRGAISVSGIGLLAMGFTFGAGAAMVGAVLVAVIHALRYRVMLHRAVFNAATFVVASTASAGLYHSVAGSGWSALQRLGPAAAGGAVYWAVNIGLLCIAMSLSEGTSFLAVWNERFRWLTVHYLAFGPLALASTLAYEKLGLTGLLAFALPPALMVLSVRQYLERTKAAVEEVRQTNAELRLANEDLRELYEFAGGLAARAHDKGALVEYAEEALSRLTGGRAQVLLDPKAKGTGLVAGGSRVGALSFEEDEGFDAARWARLNETILPQLATAFESSELTEQVRKTHLATIAALSRSMEAKDTYTGGHTERVSDVAVALARRLGFSAADLDAVEVGALLHDIGKIGIPEWILHKQGPLDDEEWEVMKKHPIVSEHILSGIDLSPIVLQIARSSHERVDGAGYPDGLVGDEIPLPARIVLVADAFDALTSDRPYRRGRHVIAALEEVRAHTGTQFCPTVVAALHDIFREEPQVLGSPLRAVVSGAA